MSDGNEIFDYLAHHKWLALPLAFAIFKWLESLAKQTSSKAPRKMADLGTSAGKGVLEASRRLNETPDVWIRKQVLVAIAAYVLSAAVLMVAGYLSVDAMVFGCSTIAIAAFPTLQQVGQAAAPSSSNNEPL